MTETTASEALPRRERKQVEEEPRNGAKLHSAYKKWLRTTEAGMAEREAIQDRLAALKSTWERKGI